MKKEKSERRIQREVMLAASASGGYTLWRNNVGQAAIGTTITANNSVLIKQTGKRIPIERGVVVLNPHQVSFGLCKGSSDLIGIRRLTVTPEMVGHQVAQFVCLECKTIGGTTTPEQRRFIDFISDAGGVAAIVRDPSDIP